MSFCKYCGEKIRFLIGEVLSCVTEIPAEEAEGTGYVPHWATCAGGMEK